MSMIAAFNMELTVTEDLTEQVEAASFTSIIHNSFNDRETITDQTAASPASEVLQDQHTFSGTTKTYDLTDFTGTGGRANVDATGLKVQGWKIRNLSTTNTLTVEEGDANPYPILGALSDVMTIPIEGKRQARDPDTLIDIAAGAKDIKLTGTDGEEFQIIIVMG